MQLTDSELADLYGHKYFHGEEYVDYQQERAALDLNFKHRLKQLKDLAPPPGRLFEIGCAYGYFLEHAARYYTVAGCDISEHAIGVAKQSGLNVQAADYLTLPPPPEPYNIICMWDTIEHIARPRPYVEKAYSELAPGGCLVISTGDAGSRLARMRREKWRMVHPPTHLHYFTSASMRRMIEGAGFNKTKISHDPFYRNVGSSLKKAGDHSGKQVIKSLGNIANKLPLIPGMNVPVNLFDIMTVIAWK
jgi:SAM-dependent methyltransferase